MSPPPLSSSSSSHVVARYGPPVGERYPLVQRGRLKKPSAEGVDRLLRQLDVAQLANRDQQENLRQEGRRVLEILGYLKRRRTVPEPDARGLGLLARKREPAPRRSDGARVAREFREAKERERFQKELQKCLKPITALQLCGKEVPPELWKPLRKLQAKEASRRSGGDPGPGAYDLRAIEDKRRRSGGRTFGVALPTAAKVADLPGPGAYDPCCALRKSRSTVSFGPARRPPDKKVVGRKTSVSLLLQKEGLPSPSDPIWTTFLNSD